MVVLGLMTFGLNPAACLLVDGRVAAFIEEERLVRRKGALDLFPAGAVQRVLKMSAMTLQDVDVVAVGRNPYRYLAAVPLTYLQSWMRCRKNLGNLRWELRQMRMLNPLSAARTIRSHLRRIQPQGPLPTIEFVGHHRAHAASAACMAGFPEATVVTMDGHGDDDCTVLWHWRDGRLRAMERYTMPQSLGWFYSAFTNLFGFRPNQDEGKLMGLAAYGQPTDHWMDKVARVLSWSGSQYRLDMSFIWYGRRYGTSGASCRMVEQFGEPRRGREARFTNDDANLAFAVQAAYEDVLQRLAQLAIALSGCRNVVLAGGCAMNCKANGALAQTLGYDRVWVQPVSSDAGCALGAALAIAAEAGDPVQRQTPLDSIYWGPSFDNHEIEQALAAAGLRATAADNIVQLAADAIADHKVIGWCQGRMEAGPRALGNRSILADPTWSAAKDRVNVVKRREPWRPFCPSLDEAAEDRYFTSCTRTPFMIVAKTVCPDARRAIPSVVHVDGSARPQSVSEKTNPRFHGLIQQLGRHTGHPVVLNTSLNVQGEPIACSPADALRTFCESALDALAIGDYWLTRPPA